jgi:hypothetical protein
MPDPVSPARLQDLISEGVDALLVGDLIHYHGRTDSEGRIEGHVEFSNLKIYSTHTGRLLWQGKADKLIQRQEKDPGGEDFYALEALRGAINQLAIQMSGLSFSHDEVYPSELPAMRQWRVAVLPPEDLRPAEEKNREERRLKGDVNYSLYTYDNQGINGSIADAVAGQWIQKLKAAEIFGSVMTIQSGGADSEKLRDWAGNGVDAVLVSRLAHAYAAVTPPYDEEPFPIWSGGMGYPPVFKAGALTRMEDVRLIETRNGKLLWSGEAEYGIDRRLDHWEPPMKVLRDSIGGALDRVVNQLSRFSPISDDKTPVSGMGLKTYSAGVR